jgi:uncharacterized membrane protein YphA (DoxX/SURF4 family)
MKKNLLVFLSLFAPATAHAHVKWFVEETPETTTQLQWTDPAMLTWIGVIVVVVLIALLLERRLTASPRLVSWVTLHKQRIYRIFSLLIGAHITLTIALGHLIAPTFFIDSPTMTVAAFLSGLTAIALISSRGMMAVGPLYIAAYVLVGMEYGWEVLEHLHVLGLGYFFGMLAFSKKEIYAPLKEWAVPVLRVTLGISLILLGLQEKLLHPDLSLAFLEEHHWNFVAMIGLDWFDDTLFVISAGMTEMLFGILYLTGAITRINTIALSVFFIATAIVLGPTEIYGHMTLLTVAVFFILVGSGEKIKIPVSKK